MYAREGVPFTSRAVAALMSSLEPRDRECREFFLVRRECKELIKDKRTHTGAQKH